MSPKLLVAAACCSRLLLLLLSSAAFCCCCWSLLLHAAAAGCCCWLLLLLLGCCSCYCCCCFAGLLLLLAACFCSNHYQILRGAGWSRMGGGRAPPPFVGQFRTMRRTSSQNNTRQLFTQPFTQQVKTIICTSKQYKTIRKEQASLEWRQSHFV